MALRLQEANGNQIGARISFHTKYMLEPCSVNPLQLYQIHKKYLYHSSTSCDKIHNKEFATNGHNSNDQTTASNCAIRQIDGDNGESVARDFMNK